MSATDTAPKTKAQLTRLRILNAAADELVERGGELEIASVAARGEVSPGLIYRYFNSRVDLIAAVVDNFYDQYDHWVMDHNPLPGGSWLNREQARVERSISFLSTQALAPIVLLNRQKEPQIATVEARRLQAHLELAIKNVELAQSKGEIDININPAIACSMVMGGVRELLVQILMQQVPLAGAPLVEQVMEFLSRAMGLSAPVTHNHK